MGFPVLLVRNLFNELQYPGHVLSASEEAAAYPVWRIATGRRHYSDAWRAETGGANRWVKVDCGVDQTASMLALDRGHNWAGASVRVQSSPDDSTWTDRHDPFSIPTSASPAGTALSAGVATAEGAALISFGQATARYWRVNFLTNGTEIPRAVGVWLGLPWAPGVYLEGEYRPRDVNVGWASGGRSLTGWESRARHFRPRSGTLRFRLGQGAAVAAAANEFVDLWAEGYPAWIVPDSDDAALAFLAKTTGGRVGFGWNAGWTYPQGDLQYVEHEPMPR